MSTADRGILWREASQGTFQCLVWPYNLPDNTLVKCDFSSPSTNPYYTGVSTSTRMRQV